eukprot:7361665-Prymnesium_polylepis.4
MGSGCNESDGDICGGCDGGNTGGWGGTGAGGRPVESNCVVATTMAHTTVATTQTLLDGGGRRRRSAQSSLLAMRILDCFTLDLRVLSTVILRASDASSMIVSRGLIKRITVVVVDRTVVKAKNTAVEANGQRSVDASFPSLDLSSTAMAV